MATDERPPSMHAEQGAARFECDLQAAQLASAPSVIGVTLTDIAREEPEMADIPEESPPAELMTWLGITLPLSVPNESPNGLTATHSENVSMPQSRTELTHLIEAGMTPDGEPVGVLSEVLSANPQSDSIEPVTTDLPTRDPALPFTPVPLSPALTSSTSPNDGSHVEGSNREGTPLPLSQQLPNQLTDAEELHPVDSAAPDAGNSVTNAPPAGYVSTSFKEVYTNTPSAATPTSHSSTSHSVEPRTELSEVVRQVRTMVTEYETRSTIQLEPAELGRMTLELVDAPTGLRAHVSAEDPAVLRFLERNVQLLEAEARLQGVGAMSFSVGADVSGGLSRGDPQQSEAEASFRKTVGWNTAPHTKPRSRRELDTNA